MRICLCLPSLLAVGLACHAQSVTTVATMATAPADPATPYQVQHDSLWRRAERIRYETAARTQAVQTGFLGLFGTRYTVNSLGGSVVRPVPVTDDARIVRIKREVVKHKTRGPEVRKVTYTSTAGKRRLYEYYEAGRLVQLELYDYPLAAGSGGNTFVTMRWVRGSYLRVSQRASTGTGGSLTQYQVYAEPEPLPR